MIKLVVTASISSFIFGLFGVSWEDVDNRIATEFPTVKTINGELLKQKLADPIMGQPLVFDVREPEEFRVSHIESAVNFNSGNDIAELVDDKDAPIVVYCSVGYRSAGVAAELQQLGYTNVRNLHHSLFEWANNRYPMVNNTGATAKVHPFNRAWGSLVEESLRSYSP